MSPSRHSSGSALETLYSPKQQVLLRVYQGNDDAFHEGTKCHMRVVSVRRSLMQRVPWVYPLGQAMIFPRLALTARGTSGGQAPVPFATQEEARLNPGASSGISSMSLCNDLGARSACSGDSAREAVEEVSAISHPSGQCRVYSASLGTCLCRCLTRFCPKACTPSTMSRQASVGILRTETLTSGGVSPCN